LALLAVGLGFFMETPPWRRLSWKADAIAWGCAAVVPMVLGLLLIRRAKQGPLARLNRIVDRLLVPLFGACNWMQLALISLVAGVGEELLFRGVVQPVFSIWLGAAAGLGLASAVFGLLHAITITYAVLATLVGTYLGWLAIATGNLVAPIITHALYDFIALLILLRIDLKSDPDGSAAKISVTEGM
jgi:uncharacterized protein